MIHLSAPPPIPTSVPTSTPVAGNSKSDFFRSAHAQGCAFYGHLGHHIHSCPAAEEYVDTGHVKIINCCLYLPTGQPILNDGHGQGLKAGVNAWLAANTQYSSTMTVPMVHHDLSPHNA